MRNSWPHCVTDSNGAVSCHTDYEPINDYNQRVDAWLESRRQMEEMLQPKLAAIRAAEQAYFDWETTEILVKHAQTQLDQMNDAIAQLRPRVQQCDASPPSDTVGTMRCKNDRNALLGMTTCDLDILTSGQVEQRQCLAWKQQDLDTAKSNERAAWHDYRQKLSTALGLPSPPIADYLDDGGLPGDHWLCTLICGDVLIIESQHRNENDKRETYAMTYYKLLGLRKGLREQAIERLKMTQPITIGACFPPILGLISGGRCRRVGYNRSYAGQGSFWSGCARWPSRSRRVADCALAWGGQKRARW